MPGSLTVTSSAGRIEGMIALNPRWEISSNLMDTSWPPISASAAHSMASLGERLIHVSS